MTYPMIYNEADQAEFDDFDRAWAEAEAQSALPAICPDCKQLLDENCPCQLEEPLYITKLKAKLFDLRMKLDHCTNPGERMSLYKVYQKSLYGLGEAERVYGIAEVA